MKCTDCNQNLEYFEETQCSPIEDAGIYQGMTCTNENCTRFDQGVYVEFSPAINPSEIAQLLRMEFGEDRAQRYLGTLNYDTCPL